MNTVKLLTGTKKCGMICRSRDVPGKLSSVLLAVGFAVYLLVCGLAGIAAEINAASQYRRPAAGWVNSLKPKGKPAGTMRLAKDGKTEYGILIPAAPTTMEEKAAADLAQWLKALTDASFTIVKEVPETLPGRVISVGRTALRNASGIAVKDMHMDGYGIAFKDGNLFITGGIRRGIINGVYALLEEDLGCRWYQSGDDGAVIPHKPTLSFQPVSRTFVPPFEMLRGVHYSDASNLDWGLRNRIFHWWGVSQEWGGYARWTPDHCHTYESYISSAEFLEKHPEYFMMTDNGKRISQQICPSNPDVNTIVINKARALLSNDPSAVYLDVSPNDGGGACHCPDCRAVIDREGTEMAPLLLLLNKVADSIREEHPQVLVTTLAYLNTVVPPKSFGPRPNVMIWLCTDAHAWGYGDLFFSETIKSSRAMQAWHDKWKTPFIVWDYPSNWGVAPVNFNLPVIAANLRWYVKRGAKGILYQTEHNNNYGIDHSYQRCWIFAKLGWDPTLDTKQLVRDFNTGFYGAAAPQMQAYDDMLWSAWKTWHQKNAKKIPWDTAEAAKKNRSGRVSVDAKFWAVADKHLVAAEKAVLGDPVLRQRVRTARLPLQYMKLEKGPGKDIAAYTAMITDFEADARKANCLIIEGVVGPPITEDLPRIINKWHLLIGRLQVPVDAGAVFADSATFNLAMYVENSQRPAIVRDPLAITGVVTRQPGNNASWSIQWNIPVSQLKAGQKYAVRVRVRMDGAGTEGAALTTGVYDQKNAAYPMGIATIPVAKISAGEYRWIEIGEYVPGESQVVWVAPTVNPDNVSAIYTERIELIPVK